MRVYKHLDSDFRIDNKIFLIQVDEKSVGDTIIFTERSKFRSYSIHLDLGAIAWLRDRVKDACLEELKLENLVSHRNSVRRVSMEKRRNNCGEFLQISVLENSGVRFVVVPGGKRREGWESLRVTLIDLLRRRMLGEEWIRKTKFGEEV